MQTKSPLVSVHLITYNHAKYVRAALDGIFMQKCSYSFEVLVADDCSTDTTQSVIREYYEQHRDSTYLFFKEVNVGPLSNHESLFGASKGKYIALLEGDDYWTDPYKLQKQVDFLEKHPEVAGCFHNATVVDENSNKTCEEWYDANKRAQSGNKLLFSQEECLTLLKHRYPTCSLMFRANAVKKIPDWFLRIPSGDFALDLLITDHGTLAFIPENMAAYRVHGGGIWQGVSEERNQQSTLTTLYNLYTRSPYGRKYPGIFKRAIIPKARMLYKACRKRRSLSALNYAFIALRCGWLSEKIRRR